MPYTSFVTRSRVFKKSAMLFSNDNRVLEREVFLHGLSHDKWKEFPKTFDTSRFMFQTKRAFDTRRSESWGPFRERTT